MKYIISVYKPIILLFTILLSQNLNSQNTQQIFLPFQAECLDAENEDCLCIPQSSLYPFFDVSNGASGTITFKINIIYTNGNNFPFTPIDLESDYFTLESVSQANAAIAQIRMTYEYDSNIDNATFTLNFPEPFCSIEITTELPTVPESCLQMEDNISIEINDIVCNNDQFFIDYDINVLSDDLGIDEENIADHIEMTLIKSNGNTIEIGNIEGLFIGNQCVLERNDIILMRFCTDVIYNGQTSFCCKELEFQVNC